MGQIKSTCAKLCSPDRSLIQALLLPEQAPEWYRKLILGGSGELHTEPAPEGSLLLLGYISLAVPDLQTAGIYYFDGLSLGQCQSAPEGEMRANLGPSQIRLPAGPVQRWPGEIRIWVEDIRATTDMFNMVGRTLGTDLVDELQKATSGGEFALELKCPFRTNWIHVSEAPSGWAKRLRAIGHNPSIHDAEYPVKTKNALAISDAIVKLHTRGQVAGASRFYEHFFGTTVTKKFVVYNAQAVMDCCFVHFGPGEGLHQTLSFKADSSSTISGSLGSICLYLRTRQKFHLCFARCKMAGILLQPGSSWEEVQASCEFQIRGIIDPQDNSGILPMEHMIRFSAHPECPVHLES